MGRITISGKPGSGDTTAIPANGAAIRHAPSVTNKGYAEAGLELLASMLSNLNGCVESAFFEFKRVPGQPIGAGQMHCHPGDEPSQEILTSFLSNKENFSGPSGCFEVSLARTGSRPARIIGLRLSEGEVGFAGGYARFESEPSAEIWAVAHTICDKGSLFLSQLRRNAVKQKAEAIAKSFQARMGEVLRLSADTYWEADDLGIIGKVIELSEGPEAVVLRLIEGRTIPFPSKETGVPPERFYNLTLEVRDAQGALNVVSLSGQHIPDDGWHGIAKIVPTGLETPTTFRQARTLVEQLQAAHDQESSVRRETELILDGLRVLTSGIASREIFQQLLGLLAPALEFQESVVLQRDWSNRIAACAGTAPDLVAADWSKADGLFGLKDVAVSIELPDGLVVPSERRFRSALAVMLQGGSKATVLVCLHERPKFFTAKHLGLATRLSLVASQAFLNEEERQKVVDASKLAAIGEMAAGIVHEINQPLTAMTLATGNLLDFLETGDDINRQWLGDKLQKLHGQIGRMSKIIANMKVLSRRSDGTLETFDVDTAINDAIGIVQHKLTQAKVVLQVSGERNLKGLGNLTEFAQVIMNLVTNAHDAMVMSSGKTKEAADKERRITVTTNAAGPDSIECLIQDSGSGFPEKHMDKAFEAFFTTKPAGQGTGLGLALCRRIIQNMGGTITLSNWAGGAEVRVIIKKSAG